MSTVHTANQDDLTRILAARLREVWDAYQRLDAPAHNAILTDDYTAVHPDGSVHPRPPTAQEIAAAPIGDYSLTEVRAVPLGPDSALVNYLADVDVPSNGSPMRVKFVVGEIWLKRSGQWKCRYYQATLAK